MSNWHKWEKIPETPIRYLDENEWKEFVKFALRMKPSVNSLWQRITVWFWIIKIKYLMCGWYGFWEEYENGEEQWIIYIRESKYTPRLLHHEMGHIIQLQHTKRPGIMAPIWFMRWF